MSRARASHLIVARAARIARVARTSLGGASLACATLVGGCDQGATTPLAESATTAATAPVTTSSGPPGSDVDAPTLPEADRAYVDKRDGWGWSDKCWKSLEQGLLGYAMAQCTRGLEVAPERAGAKGARPSLLYNLGLIAERAGRKAEAARHLEASLALREHPEVRAALTRVRGGSARPSVASASAATTASAAATGDVRDCKACSEGCLDRADALDASSPDDARKQALRGCERSCKDLSAVHLLRCHARGLLRDRKVEGKAKPAASATVAASASEASPVTTTATTATSATSVTTATATTTPPALPPPSPGAPSPPASAPLVP